MPIRHNEGGSTTITGDSINFLQLVAQKGAVGLELKGLKGRGPVLWRRLREHYQIPGTGKRKASHQQVYDWLCSKVDELRLQQKHIDTLADGTIVETGGDQ